MTDPDEPTGPFDPRRDADDPGVPRARRASGTERLDALFAAQGDPVEDAEGPSPDAGDDPHAAPTRAVPLPARSGSAETSAPLDDRVDQYAVAPHRSGGASSKDPGAAAPVIPGAHARTEAPPPRRRGPRDMALLAPLAVIVVSIGALAVVFLLTRGGTEENRASAPTSPPSVLTTEAPSETAPQPTPEPSSAAPPSDPTPSETPSAPPSTTDPTQEPSSTAAPETTGSPEEGAETSAGQGSSADGDSPESSPEAGSPPAPPKLPDGLKSCGEGIGVSRSTTCQFAKSVADQVRANGPDAGRFSVKAHSSTTDKDYDLQCNAGPVTVCVGGRNAAIYVSG